MTLKRFNIFWFRSHKKSGNQSNISRIDIGLAVEEGVSDEVACTCCNHKKTLPTGDLDLLAIAQNLASARTFCKLEYCLNEKFTPYCLDKSPTYPWSRDVSSLFKIKHDLIFISKNTMVVFIKNFHLNSPLPLACLH